MRQKMGIQLDSNKNEGQNINRYCRWPWSFVPSLGLKKPKILRKKFFRKSFAKNIGKIAQVKKKL